MVDFIPNAVADMPGDIHAVIGLALRSVSQPKVPPMISEEARQISGIKGWVRPVKKLNWKTPRLEGDEREDALDRLSPRPIPDEMRRYES